ncbi:MAG TPA: DUF4382 domain-containing protein [Steroidobacteraceae bacterium]|nr:DUF4382 domain-containing protein [Steroidobacteraceae bacterium]
MSHRQLPVSLGCIAGLACVLAGCSGSTEVSQGGNTPTQYQHVWITTQDVWFSNSDTAGPDDDGWVKYTLSTPTTIDLVTLNSGNLSSITSGLRLLPGTYSQVRLIPVDATAALASSAQNAGALYNSEADYVDSSGTTHQLQLELLNPDKGIGIQTSLKVPIGSVSAALAGTGALGAGSTTSTSSLGTTTTSPFGTPSATSTTTGTTGFGLGTGTTTTSTTGTSSGPANSYAVFLDGTSDLVPFTYASNAEGIMLSQHGAAYDLSKAGGISGQLTLTNITTSTSGLPAIEVSAETLSADGTRHVIASTTTVQADGSFLLYPLAADTNGVFYDVVIHGPGIATIIIKAVEIVLPSSSHSLFSSTSTTPATAITPATTTSSSSTTTSGSATTNTTANNVVDIGTLTPRAVVDGTSYTANLATSPAATLPAGALVRFYQTLNRQNEVPYVIEVSPIDPFNEVLFSPQTLSPQTVDSGTWSSSGTNVTVVSAAPKEGTGNYIVSAGAPSYSDGPLTTIIKAPTSSTSTPVTVTLPALTLAPGTSAGTLTALVRPSSPGRYDAGELLVSHNGTLVATASIGAALADSGGSVAVNGLPAESPGAVYYVSVRAWNSSDPAGTLQRQWYPSVIDMTGSTSSAIVLTVN